MFRVLEKTEIVDSEDFDSSGESYPALPVNEIKDAEKLRVKIASEIDAWARHAFSSNGFGG